MLKGKVFALALLFAAAAVHAVQLSDNAASALASVFEKPYGHSMFSALSAALERLSSPQEKRGLLFAFAEYEERAGHFESAAGRYAQAAEIAPEDFSIYLDGARCFMYMNESEKANALIQKTLLACLDAGTLCRARFYAACIRLSGGDIDGALGQIRSHLSNKSFSPYFSQMLFILWYAGSDSSAGARLLSEYPHSAEASIVRGEASILPRPFWYLMPAARRPFYIEGTDPSSAGIWQQTGFFRSRINAESQAEELLRAGFKVYIRRETRAGGAVYFSVLTPENETGTTAMLLKEKGFESYLVID